MNQFEYLIPFVGFIYALSVTDILVSVHRLVVERERVKVHLVPVIWAVVAFLMIINGWWAFFQLNSKISLSNAGQLFLLALLPMMLFLISSLSLPHKVNNNLCMWAYFDANKKPFYLCHFSYLLLIPIVLSNFADELNIVQIALNVGFACILIPLIWLKHWAWHFGIGLVLMVSLLFSIFSQAI